MKTNFPKISIITVCYNSAKTIEDTLRSVISQDYPNIEYIVIDGNSMDETISILKRYSGKINILISEKDNGIYDAMNKGITLATGDIVGLINADDVYANTKVISKIAKVFLDENVDACFGDLVYFSSKQPEKIVRYWRAGPFVSGRFAKGWSPPHPTFFVKKSVYQTHGNFNLNYSMGNDIELMMRFLEKYCIKSAYIPEILVRMRLGGVSNQGVKPIILQNKNILEAARSLNIPITPWKFFMYKLMNRLSQFIFKPRSNKHYVN